jgi:segregation and condensation protein B
MNDSNEIDEQETNKYNPPDFIDFEHVRLLEAILFASREPITERVLANRLPEGANLKAILLNIKNTYSDRGVNLVQTGKSWAFRTSPELAQLLNKEINVSRKLSRAAIETLSIIAYHQPISRAEIEEVRGVGLSKGTMDVLLEASWIKPRGRRRTPGRPITWGTTDGFLDQFGLEDIRDLPGMEDLKAAGLLDSGPAISVYTSTAAMDNYSKNSEDVDDSQLELIETVDHEVLRGNSPKSLDPITEN